MPDESPRPRFETLTAYQRAPAPPGTRLRLDANEGQPPAMELVLSALRDNGVELFQRYPDARPLEAALGRRFGVAPEQVFVAAGADEVIDRCCRAFLPPGKSMLMAEPGFEMFEQYATLCGARMIGVQWAAGSYPRSEVCAAITEDVAVVALVTPNNPTGEVATLEDLRAIAAAAPHALIILDHAYAEFADRDLTPDALDLPNVVVVRTFSKAWGLAGCRVGYALGPARLVQPLRAAGGPFPVSGPSIAIAMALLERGEAPRDAVVARVRRERSELFTLLKALGARPRPSQGNFVFCEPSANASEIHRSLAESGILVRRVQRSGAPVGLRIGLPGDGASFEILVAAIRAAFERVRVA